jgi:hypothetical protein
MWKVYQLASSRTPYAPDTRDEFRDRTTIGTKPGRLPSAGRGLAPHPIRWDQDPVRGKRVPPRSGSVLAVESQESSSVGVPPSDLEEGAYPELEANMAAGQAAGGYVSNTPSLYPSWRKTETVSPSPSAVSISTCGWSCPGGSVISETLSKTQSGYPPRRYSL